MFIICIYFFIIIFFTLIYLFRYIFIHAVWRGGGVVFHGLCLNVLCMVHVSLLYKHDVGSYWFYMKFSGDFSEKEIFFKNQMKCYRAVFFVMNRWKIRISDKTFSKTYTVRMFIYIYFFNKIMNFISVIRS